MAFGVPHRARYKVDHFGSFVTSIPVSSLTLRRYRAERLLRRDFAGLRSHVLAVVRVRLRAHGVTLDSSDLEACYANAWQGLYTSVLRGEQVDNPSAWLVLVTFRRAIDESRAASARRLAGETSQMAIVDPDLAGTLDDRAKLQQVLEALRSRLTARECEAASLCYLQGLSRSDAAARMGLSESRMRKLMDGAGAHKPGLTNKFGALLDTIGGGGWCEQQSSLMRAYAFGILDPDGPRHALAALHCRECPACRAYVATLRGLAAVLPPLPLRLALTGATGTAAGSSAAGSSAAGPSAAGFSSGAFGAAGAVPLALKLAVVGAIALSAGGYVALAGTSRHGSPSHASGVSGERTARSGADLGLYEADFASFSKSSPGTQRALRRRALTRNHPRPAHDSRRSHPSAGDAAVREFGPERVAPPSSPGVPLSSLGAPTSSPGAPQTSPANRRAAKSSGEFGFE